MQLTLGKRPPHSTCEEFGRGLSSVCREQRVNLPRSSCLRRFVDFGLRGEYCYLLMRARHYWLDFLTGVTWNEFVDAGSSVSGFRESRWVTTQKIEPGGYF